MGSFSDYLENKVLDHVFKNTVMSQPTNLYVALYTAAPSDAGGGTECSGGAYARVNCNGWNVASGGALDNTSAITYAQATAAWGTVTHFSVYDALTAGNMIVWGSLTTSKSIGIGDTAQFAAGELDVTLD